MENRYRGSVEGKTATTRFTGSLDMDAAFKQAEPEANRWDFGVGMHKPGKQEFAVWVEPHSASSLGEVKTILAKLDWLQGKLDQPEFRQLKALTDACAAGGIDGFIGWQPPVWGFAPAARRANMLAAHGMNPPSTRWLSDGCTHLPHHQFGIHRAAAALG